MDHPKHIHCICKKMFELEDSWVDHKQAFRLSVLNASICVFVKSTTTHHSTFCTRVQSSLTDIVKNHPENTLSTLCSSCTNKWFCDRRPPQCTNCFLLQILKIDQHVTRHHNEQSYNTCVFNTTLISIFQNSKRM